MCFIKSFTGKLPFYTYTPRTARKFAYLIKGLHSDVEVSDVRDELIELDIPIKHVDKFNNTKNPIFMVTVPKTVSIKELAKKAMYIQRTHIAKRELTQCKKCQAWGHATANYHLNIVRCVKRAACHRSFKCQKDRNKPAVC